MHTVLHAWEAATHGHHDTSHFCLVGRGQAQVTRGRGQVVEVKASKRNVSVSDVIDCIPYRKGNLSCQYRLCFLLIEKRNEITTKIT